MAITKEDVFDAADAIAAEGGNPSQLSVRKRLGSGSHTTIGQYLVEWRARQESIRISAMLRNAAPQEVLDRLTEVGNEIWRLASELVESRLQAERTNLRQEIKEEFEIELREALNLNEQLQVALETALAACKNEAARADAAVELSQILGRLIPDQAGSCDGGIFSTPAPCAEEAGDVDRLEVLRLRNELQAAQKKLRDAEAKIEVLQGQWNARNRGSDSDRSLLAIAENCVKPSGDEE